MGKAQRFRELFKPVRIGEMEIRNRIVMPPMGTRFANEEGYANEQHIAYYRERSKGGVGLIIVEITIIDPGGLSWPGELVIFDDKYIPGLQELAQAIKEHGARAAIQINHTGCHAQPRTPGEKAVAASAIADPPFEIPRALSVDEIRELVQKYAMAAVRAKKAGFDGVEIHCAHHYLISGFLSSGLNQRRDEYGGSLENRARLMVEVIHAVRQAVGPNYPVWIRLDGRIFGDGGGITIDEAEVFARMAERAGAQAIHVSAQCSNPHFFYRAPIPFFIPGGLLDLASRIKNVVKVPVIAVGNISPSLAEKTLKEGKADLVSMGRALVSDPELPNKLATGRLLEVQTCITCIQCINFWERPCLVCSVNPAAGKELESELLLAANPKDVLVVGGGPAGMKAAITAAKRGHKVTLCERRPRLGGALTVGAVLSRDLEDLTKSLVNQMKSLPIGIKLSTKVTPELIAKIKPQAVIVATGGVPITPELPGVEGKNVISIKDIYGLIGDPRGKRNGSRGKLLLRLASVFVRYFYNPPIMRWFLKRGFLFGKRVIIIGGQLAGLELGAFLSEMGRRVTIVEPSERIGEGLCMFVQVYYQDKIINGEGAILTGVKLERITPKGLVITVSNGISVDLAGDTVVLALGARADSQQVESLQGKAPEVYSVGDCVEPKNILEAIAGGFRAARAV